MKRIVLTILLASLLSGDIFAQTASGWSLYPSYQRYLRRVPWNTLSYFYLRGSTDKKIIAITFDDGPLQKTGKIIELLSKRRVPAAFFLLCSNINGSNASLYKSDLFTTGIHGYRHTDFRKFGKKRIERDIGKCMDIFKRYTLKAKHFRPPYGMISSTLADVLRKYSLKGVLWSIDSGDWEGYRGDRLLKRVFDHIVPGTIILFHDHGISVRDLGKFIDEAHRRGYKIVPLDYLMRYSSEYP